METIDFVYQSLPFLTRPDDDNLVNAYIDQARIELQCDLGKTDAQLFDETAYNYQEKMIVAFHTSCSLLLNEALKNTGGSGGVAPTGNKILSKAKADVTEAQWTIPKASDGNAVIVGVPGMIASFKNRMCNLAKSCDISLTACKDPDADEVTGNTVFWNTTCDKTLGGCGDGGCC